MVSAGIALLAGAAPPVRAEPGLGLNWVRLPGAESCISAAELMNRLEAGSKRILFVRSGDALLSLDGYVRPVAGPPTGWAVTLEVSAADGSVLGRRALDVLVGSCDVVTAAAELTFGLTLDPDGMLDGGIPLERATRDALDALFGDEDVDPRPEDLPEHTSAPQAQRAIAQREPDREKDRTAADEAPARTTPSITWFHLSAIGSLGELPGVGLGAGLRATLLLRLGWQLELGFSAFAERTSELPHGDGSANTSAQLGALALCPLQLGSALAFCAGAEYGRQNVDPGLDGRENLANRAIANALAYGALRLTLAGTLSFRAAATLLVPVLRNRYHYDSPGGETEFHRMSPLAGRVELGLGWGF